MQDEAVLETLDLSINLPNFYNSGRSCSTKEELSSHTANCRQSNNWHRYGKEKATLLLPLSSGQTIDKIYMTSHVTGKG